MKILHDKKKIVQILFVSSIVLLVFNFASDKLFKHTDAASLPSISINEADSLFISSLKSLGINENQVKPKKKKTTSDIKNYRIIVPNDLPIPLIVMEVKNNFKSFNVDIIFKERSIGGKTFLTVVNDENEIIIASEFDYDKTITRPGGQIAFVLEGFDKLNEQSMRVLLSAPEQFGILLTPSKNNKKLADSLTRYRKEFLVLFNDNITELEYKLSAGYSPKRIRGSLNSIIENFSRSVCMTIDEGSDIYNSELKDFIKKDLASKKILLLEKKSFFQPDGSGIEDRIKSFRNMLDELSGGGSKLILIPAEEYLSYLPEIIRFRKTGYKFVNPSEAVLRR